MTTAGPSPLARFVGRWRNTIYSAADHIWLLALWAISTPVFITLLGAEAFGVWVLVNAVIGLGGVMSLGFGEATVRYVAKYRGLDRPRDLIRIVDTTLGLYAVTGAICAAGLWTAAPALTETVFHLTGPAGGPAVIALRLAGLALFCTAYLKTFEAVLNGFERFDLTARIGIFARSFIILGNLALALAGYGLIALIGCALVGLIGQTAALYLCCRRFAPGIRIFGRIDMVTLREVANFGAQSWLQICAGAMNTVVDRFLVGALIDPAAAGVYTVCLQLAQQVHLLLTRGLAFLMPATSREASHADAAHARCRAYRASCVLVLLLVGSVALPLFVLSAQILQLWVGEEFAVRGTGTLRVMTVYFALWGGFVPMFYLLNGAGRPGWNTIATLSHGTFGLLLAWMLLPGFGIEGAAWARIAALPAALPIIWALHRFVLPGGAWKVTALLFGWLTLLFGAALGLLAVTGALLPPQPAAVLIGGPLLAVAGGGLALVPWLIARIRAGQAAPSA